MGKRECMYLVDGLQKRWSFVPLCFIRGIRVSRYLHTPTNPNNTVQITNKTHSSRESSSSHKHKQPTKKNQHEHQTTKQPNNQTNEPAKLSNQPTNQSTTQTPNKQPNQQPTHQHKKTHNKPPPLAEKDLMFSPVNPLQGKKAKFFCENPSLIKYLESFPSISRYLFSHQPSKSSLLTAMISYRRREEIENEFQG